MDRTLTFFAIVIITVSILGIINAFRISRIEKHIGI